MSLLLGLACVAVAGCSHEDAATDGAERTSASGAAQGAVGSIVLQPVAGQAPQAARPLPNIIVYLVDTLRADRLGLYGNERDTSPAIDALGARAAVFDSAMAQAPWTLPSVTSLFTGVYPTSHQVVSNFHKLGPQAETLVEFMHALGYHTVGFVANTLGGKGAGLDQGYDEFHEQQSVRDLLPEQIAAGALSMQPLYDWAAAYDGSQPVFLYVHSVEPHTPWSGAPKTRAPWFTGTEQEKQLVNDVLAEQRGLMGSRNNGMLKPGDAERLDDLSREAPGRVQAARDLYDGDVRQASDNLHHLLGILSGRPRWSSTVIVFLADHGEELYEHGNWFHGQSLFQEQLHVPLIVRVPGLTDGGLRLAQPVQVLDVAPTLADLLGVPPLPQWQGRSLLPLLRAAKDGGTGQGVAGGATEPAAEPVFSMRINVDRKLGGERGDLETALIEDGWKLILHQDVGRASLFDLRADPGEQHDLSAEEPGRARAMLTTVQQKLRALPLLPLRATAPDDADAEAEKRENLKELGYVDGQGKAK